MLKDAASGTLGIRPRTKQPASNAGLMALRISCGFPGVSISLGKTTPLSASTRIPERRPVCSILARPQHQAENQHGRDIPSPNGNSHPEAGEADKREPVI